MNEANFEFIFNEYRNALLAWFRRRECGEDSEDLVQQTFIRAYRKLDDFRGDAKVYDWLVVIARNVWKNYIRSRKTQKADTSKEIPLDAGNNEWIASACADDPLRHLLKNERLTKMQKALLDAIQELPPQMRQCMLLRVFQDLQYHSIAKYMSLSEGAVKAHISTAKKKLRMKLDPDLLDSEARHEA